MDSQNARPCLPFSSSTLLFSSRCLVCYLCSSGPSNLDSQLRERLMAFFLCGRMSDGQLLGYPPWPHSADAVPAAFCLVSSPQSNFLSLFWLNKIVVHLSLCLCIPSLQTLHVPAGCLLLWRLQQVCVTHRAHHLFPISGSLVLLTPVAEHCHSHIWAVSTSPAVSLTNRPSYIRMKRSGSAIPFDLLCVFLLLNSRINVVSLMS